MEKVLFVTSRVDDARELTYRALNVWSVTVPTDLAFAPALAATENFDFALFDIGLVGAWAPDLLRAVARKHAMSVGPACHASRAGPYGKIRHLDTLDLVVFLEPCFQEVERGRR